MNEPLKITPNTKVSELLRRYGDIAPVMESLGVKRIGKYNIRRLVAKVLTIRRAAFVHRMPVEELMDKVRTAIATFEQHSDK